MTFKLIGFDEDGVRHSQGKKNVSLVCLIEGGGKLAIWGSVGSVQNIDTVELAGMPCDVDCVCIKPEAWAVRHGHIPSST